MGSLLSPPPTEDDLRAFEGQKLLWVRGSRPEPEPPLLLLGCSRFPAPSLLEACCGRFPQRLSQGGDGGGGEFPLQALTVFRGSVTAALLRLQEALACVWNAVAVEVAQRWGRSILTRLRLICLMTQGQNNRPPPEKDSEKLVLPLRPLLLCCILPADPAQPLIFLLLLNSQTGFDPDKSPSRPLAPPCHVQRGSESEMEGISASWSVRVKLSAGSG